MKLARTIDVCDCCHKEKIVTHIRNKLYCDACLGFLTEQMIDAELGDDTEREED